MDKVTWRSPSNIALVKYWGKRNEQIPMNPSISMTLKESYTETSLAWKKGFESDKVGVKLLFEGAANIAFEQRLTLFTNRISDFIPVLKGLDLSIESNNSFPHSSGIASSASSFSALALCLVDLEKQLTGKIHGFSEYYEKASFIARLGSGSAARSVYSGYTLWGSTPINNKSSNEYAIPINDNIHSIFKDYHDAILIITDKTKKVSSSIGHDLMNNHPYAFLKFEESLKNTERLLAILKNGEQSDFVNLIENEALSLHAMMMTSNPSYLLMEPNTVTIIEKTRSFRKDTGIKVCFTLDAGANVHLLYPGNEKHKVVKWIEQELLSYCINNRWIDDKIGNGPKKQNNETLTRKVHTKGY